MSILQGNAVSLEVNTGTIVAPVWFVTACITENGLDKASDEIDGGSKCGPLTVPGTATWSASVGGFYELDPTATQASGELMFDYANDEVERQWRMRNADNSYYRVFLARVGNYTEQADYNTLVNFTGDLLINGLVSKTPPAP